MSLWRHLRLLFACALAFFAASCGSGEGPDIYAAVPTAVPPVPGLTTDTASGVAASDVVGGSLHVATDSDLAALLISEPVSQERFAEVQDFYENYLDVRASVIDSTLPSDAIDALVTDSGRRNVVEAREYNDSLHLDERLSAIEELWLFSNVEVISQVDDQTILVEDCTERHEVNSLDQFWVYWVTNEVLIDVSSGEMLVSDHTTTHNGFLETEDPIGCAPVSFRERAEAVSAQSWTDLAAWSRDADSRSEDNLSPAIGGALRERVLKATDTTGDVEVEPAVEDVSFEAVGLDTFAALGVDEAKAIVVVVDSCHRFPDGRSGTNLATGAAVSDLSAGAEQALRFRVLLDPSRTDRIDQVIAIDYLAESCAR